MKEKTYIHEKMVNILLPTTLISLVFSISFIGGVVFDKESSTIINLGAILFPLIFFAGFISILLSSKIDVYEKNLRYTNSQKDALRSKIKELKELQKKEDFELKMLIKKDMVWKEILIPIEQIDLNRIRNKLKEQQKIKEDKMLDTLEPTPSKTYLFFYRIFG